MTQKSNHPGNRPLTRMLLPLLLALGAAGCNVEMESEPPGGIHVTGIGELDVTPDMARVTFQITRDGVDASVLKSDLDKVVADVLTLTANLNIAPEDVIAAAVNLSPRYRRDGDSRIMEGVTASRTVAVTLRVLDDYGALINGALRVGINGVSGVQLDVAARDELTRQALAAAITDAMTNAAEVAEGFGVALGELVNVDVEPGYPSPLPVARMAMEAAGPDFSAGQIQIRRSVRASFGIGGD